MTVVESVQAMERLLFRVYFVKYYSDHADMTIINIILIFINIIDGVIGVLINDEFVEESNFSVTEIVMKVKVHGHGEAGWLVKVTEVTEDEPQ